jgi:hypothetical protein
MVSMGLLRTSKGQTHARVYTRESRKPAQMKRYPLQHNATAICADGI